MYIYRAQYTSSSFGRGDPFTNVPPGPVSSTACVLPSNSPATYYVLAVALEHGVRGGHEALVTHAVEERALAATAISGSNPAREV